MNAPATSTATGIDLGATNVKVVRVDPSGAVLSRESMPTTDDWRDAIRSLMADDDGPVGVCAPGLAPANADAIAWMRGRLAGVQGLSFTALFDRTRPVPVLNDAHAALLGETGHGGAAAGAAHAILLTLGTGVGGAILADGKLLRGHLGRAGHLGHVTVDASGPPDLVNTPGSLEDAIGDCTVARRTAGRFATTRDLVDAHRAGDRDATAVWLRSVRDLAAAIASLINVVDPQVVIIGGGIAAAGPALFQPLARHLDQMEWRPNGHPVPVVPAALGEWAGAIGAARAALQG